MENPKVKLGGKEFEIPPLALRQIKVVVPAIQKFRSADLTKLTVEDVENLATISYHAITRSDPRFKREEFENLPVTVDELVQAVWIIAPQAGMVTTKVGEPESGEAQQPGS